MWLTEIACCYSNEAEVVNNVDDLYNVGTFVQITELQEFGESMRMIIQGHRRYGNETMVWE